MPGRPLTPGSKPLCELLPVNFARPLRQRHVGQRLHIAPALGHQIGEQLRIAHHFAVPAQRARLAGLVVEDGVAAAFDGIDAIDAQLELSAGDGDLAACFERLDGERRARASRRSSSFSMSISSR